VAVYAADWSGFNLAQITAPGGNGSYPGGAGSVYLRDTDEAQGTLLFDRQSGGNGWTALGLPGTNYFAIPDVVVVRGSGTRVRSEHVGLVLEFQNQVIVTNGGRLQINGDLDLNTNAPLTLASGGWLEVTGTLATELPLVIDGATLSVGQSLTLGQRVRWTNGGTLVVSGALTSSIPVEVNSGTLSVNQLVAPALTLTNGSVLTCPGGYPHKLEVEVMGTLTVDASSRIDVSGKGYAGGRTTGNTTVGAATGRSGGSYGGLGGSNLGSANAVYGDYADPEDWGSGSVAVAGGGLVRLRVGTLVLEGQVLANGDFESFNGTGGSGGGIYVAAGVLTGGGSIRAAGGQYSSGVVSGGGGRVAVYAADWSGFNLAQITAPGGNGSDPGGAGSVHLVRGLPHTHVRKFAPIGRHGGYVSNMLNSVTVHFNKPINTNSFDATGFVIEGPLGLVRPTGIVEVSNRTYLIDFPLLSENGAYHFTLLPSLLDAEGLPLDQNANGIPGETDDGTNFTLIVDTIGPRVTQHSPSGGVPLGLSSMRIEFNEAIDPLTLVPADIVITNEIGQAVVINGVQAVSSNRFRITFPPLRTLGVHNLFVRPNVRDVVGNLLDVDQDGTGGEPGDDVYAACFYLHAGSGLNLSAISDLGLVSWWRAEGTANDSVQVNHGTLMNGATFDSGRAGDAFSLDGVNDFIRVPDHSSLDLRNQFSIVLWLFQKSARLGGLPAGG
jgi:hypothetical protein